MLTGEEQEELDTLDADLAENAETLGQIAHYGEWMYLASGSAFGGLIGALVATADWGVASIFWPGSLSTWQWLSISAGIIVAFGSVGRWGITRSLKSLRTHQLEMRERRTELTMKLNAEQN